ncbi:MAG: hypothetical protein OXD46_13355 [Chloroflexi bacterium]|nr:hypothetical protein [Chloroflexota bacterium]
MRLIHGQESVTAGTPAQLTSEPLRAVKLWIKHGSEADGVAQLSGPTGNESGVEVGAELAEFDFTTAGRGSIDASTLYVDVSTGTQTVTWTLMVA